MKGEQRKSSTVDAGCRVLVTAVMPDAAPVTADTSTILVENVRIFDGLDDRLAVTDSADAQALPNKNRAVTAAANCFYNSLPTFLFLLAQ